MTTLTIIDKHLGTALDRHGIPQVDLGAIEFDFAPRRRGSRRKEQASYKEYGSHDVTLSGSGLVLSILVYQGIRTKNRK